MRRLDVKAWAIHHTHNQQHANNKYNVLRHRQKSAHTCYESSMYVVQHVIALLSHTVGIATTYRLAPGTCYDRGSPLLGETVFWMTGLPTNPKSSLIVLRYTVFWRKRFLTHGASWPKIVGNCIKVYLFLAKTFSEWRGFLTKNRRK